jgi:membrane-associated protease RseP (regulator of RpoE activity)
VNSISYSLVIARGDIHCSNSGAVGSNSLVITSGRLHLGRFAKVDKGAKVLERQATPLGFVKFFDPAREGIEVEAAKDGVRVKVAAEGKAFAKAGLRAGDVITAVDKEATADPEAFRRQLRSALAREEGPTLRILRAGKAVELKIPAPQ